MTLPPLESGLLVATLPPLEGGLLLVAPEVEVGTDWPGDTVTLSVVDDVLVRLGAVMVLERIVTVLIPMFPPLVFGVELLSIVDMEPVAEEPESGLLPDEPEAVLEGELPPEGPESRLLPDETETILEGKTPPVFNTVLEFCRPVD